MTVELMLEQLLGSGHQIKLWRDGHFVKLELINHDARPVAVFSYAGSTVTSVVRRAWAGEKGEPRE